MDPRRGQAFKGRRIAQHLEAERLALRVLQHAIRVHLPARFIQQLLGALQVAAQRIRIRVVRQLGQLTEHRRIQRRRQALQEAHLLGIRFAGSRHGAVGEIAARARVLPLEIVTVEPVEIEGQRQRLAHPHVPEEWTARVERIALHAAHIGMREVALDDLATAVPSPHVAARPVAGTVLEQPVELAGLEGFQSCHLVAEILEHHPLEIEGAAPHRQRIGPVAFHPLEGDALAEVHAVHHIGTAGDGALVRHGVEGLALPPATREHRQILGQNQVQLGVGALEEEAQQPVVHHLQALHVPEILPKERMPLGAHQRLERMAHVLGQHRRAIVETCLGPQLEHHRQTVLGQDHVLGQQPVNRKGLVPAGHRQRLEHQRACTVCSNAPQRERIERIEGAHARQPHQATARCVGPHIVEVGKRLRIARLATPGHAVRSQHLASRPAGQRGRPQRQAALQPGTPPNPVLSGNIHTHSHPPPRRKHQPAL